MDIDFFGPVEHYDNYDILIEASARPDKFTIVNLLIRPGSNQFFSRLEHEHFPPGTPKNDEFDFHIMNWQEVQWIVAVVPLETMPICERVAAECSVRLTRRTPFVSIDGRNKQRFPLHHDRVRFIERL